MTTLNRIASLAAETNTLFSVLLELTYRCNLDCFFCYNDLGKTGKLLTEERYFELLDELRELDVLNLTLSGGEPLANPSFWAIGRRATELAFSTRVKTNGHAVDAQVSRRLFEEVRPFLVEVSLHGACGDSHDRQTRVPGSFDRLMVNLPAMLDAGLRVKLNSTITAWNVREIEAMYGIADGLGVSLSVNVTVSPRDDGSREPLSIAARQEDLREAVRFMERRDANRGAAWGTDPIDEEAGSEPLRPGGKNCGLGSSTLTVDPFGDVFPCVQWRSPVGNLHRQSVREIWSGNQELDEVREVNVHAAKKVESLGRRGRLMAFCPALARMETGSPLEVYPSADRRAVVFSRPVPLDGALPAPFIGVPSNQSPPIGPAWSSTVVASE
jgi:MoaA/NifB/PqqE/SkfB family radical SAM enzyme